MDEISQPYATMFRLTDQEWDEFNIILDREPVFMPKMKALLAKPSVLLPED